MTNKEYLIKYLCSYFNMEDDTLRMVYSNKLSNFHEDCNYFHIDDFSVSILSEQSLIDYLGREIENNFSCFLEEVKELEKCYETSFNFTAFLNEHENNLTEAYLESYLSSHGNLKNPVTLPEFGMEIIEVDKENDKYLISLF